MNALHCALLPPRDPPLATRAMRNVLGELVLSGGPHARGRNERLAVLTDRAELDRLHLVVWSIRDPQRAAAWGFAPCNLDSAGHHTQGDEPGAPITRIHP